MILIEILVEYAIIMVGLEIVRGTKRCDQITEELSQRGDALTQVNTGNGEKRPQPL